MLVDIYNEQLIDPDKKFLFISCCLNICINAIIGVIVRVNMRGLIVHFEFVPKGLRGMILQLGKIRHML